jgi:hypothetical protein
MGKEILPSEVDLVLEKLHSESTPLIGYYVRDGVKVMKRGVLAGVSREHGVVIANDAGPTPAKDYLAVKIGFNAAGVGCTFWYGDIRDLPPEDRAETVEVLGDTALAFYCPDGGRLTLYFSI